MAGTEPGMLAEPHLVRPLRAAIDALSSGDGADLSGLVLATGLPRRRVEQLLAELGEDLDRDGRRYRLAPPRADQLRRQLGDRPGSPPTAAWDRAQPIPAGLVEELSRIVAARPAPDRGLDHVGATVETAARRGLWLDRSYDLSRTRLLCVGDHDLTALATAAVRPDAEIMVCDVDERILAFVDQQARRRGWQVTCRWADFRLGLAPSAQQWADLIFTDPPYTPEGVETFLMAGLQGLRDPDQGRLLMAYGFGEHQPALGLKVQQTVQGLQLAFEAILPDFNAYHGAQAIGSHSDLYVCRPTARTWRALPGLLERRRTAIYTHGAQSVESTPAPGDRTLEELAAAGGPATLVIAAGTIPPGLRSGPLVQLGTLLERGSPPQQAGRRHRAVADLEAVPASWALRVLLASDATELRLIVPAAAADELPAWRQLLTGKFRLSIERAGSDRTVLAADAAGDGSVRGRVLARAHGKLANVWREALVASARDRGSALTKNQARELVGAAAPPGVLSATLLELPGHQLAEVLDAVTATEAELSTRSASPEAG